MEAVIASELTGASLLTGRGSVLTAAGVECPDCPDCPVYPPQGFLPTPSRDYVIAKLAGVPRAGVSVNQRDMLVHVKDAMIASGVWSCVGSCNGVVVSTADLWLSYLDLRGSGGGAGFSWIILQNQHNTVQVMFRIMVSGSWAEVAVWVSPSAGFTGGTTLLPPVAADGIQINPAVGAWLGTGPVGNPQFYAFVWTSTDGANTRIVWWFNGKRVSIWEFDGLIGTPTATWVPFMSWVTYGGLDYSTPNPGMGMLLTYLNSSYRFVRTPAGVWEQVTGAAYEAYGGQPILDTAMRQNEFTGQWLWGAPVGVARSAVASPRNGFLGYTSDLWWIGALNATTPILPDGTTIDSGRFILIGQMMMVWDGTLNPPTGGGPTTDYPAASFYGRNVS